MNDKQAASGWAEPAPTAVLVLADGTVLEGHGFGATGHAARGGCLNTAMTGAEQNHTAPALIRKKGRPNAVIAHEPSGTFDLPALKAEARAWPGLVGMDLVPMVTSGQRFTWDA